MPSLTFGSGETKSEFGGLLFSLINIWEGVGGRGVNKDKFALLYNELYKQLKCCLSLFLL